jgi:S-adenosylmethionine:tRNA ribosyltransferase-isomerase
MLDYLDYHLPSELIAQKPLADRNLAKLLVVSLTGHWQESSIGQLPYFFQENDLLIVNNSKVLKARLKGFKETGGKAEVLLERFLNDHEAIVHLSCKNPRPGLSLIMGNVLLCLQEKTENLWRITSEAPLPLLFEQHGEVPLPPYITRAVEQDDEIRYQTYFAKRLGSVAAPTAGLHFNDTLIARLKAQGISFAEVTLHVGAGTFLPVKDLNTHVMHREYFHIPEDTLCAIETAKRKKGKIIAVGTTSVRALESAALNNWQKLSGETQLMITPGFHFKVVNGILTNFHMPRSTLLLLVAAFLGAEQLKQVYAHAIAKKYRFYSYGDAMLILP